MLVDASGSVAPAIRDQAATVLARAFVSDPMFVTAMPDPVRRAAALPFVFRSMTAQTAGAGTIDLAPDGRGAALWIPGSAAPVGIRQVLAFGYARIAAATGLRPALRLAAIQDGILAEHQRVAPDEHVYLFALGVDPTAQGQGVGSLLLRTGCARVDAQGLPAFLETNLPQNVRLYERFGFEVREHLTPTAKKPFDTWLMLRPAQPSGHATPATEPAAGAQAQPIS